MKKAFVVAMFVCLVTMPMALHAQDAAPLGMGFVSIKGGYVVFSEGVTEDDGIYLGLEGYGRVAPNFYLGAEVAGAYSISLFSDEMTLAPVEFNVKYARAVGSNFVVAGGGGLSYSYAEFREEFFFEPDVQDTKWLFGGQIFGDFLVRIKWFDLGINAKYQLVQDFEEVSADFSNIRIGLQLGVIF